MHLLKRAPYLIPLLLFCLSLGNVQGQSVLIAREQHSLPFIKDSTSLVNSLNRIGMLYHLENPDSCFHYGMKAKAIAIRLHYTKGETDADNVIASALYLRGLFRESLALFSKTLAAYRQQSDTANMAQLTMNLASVYEGIADSTRAIALSRQAIETGAHLGADSIMSMVYANYCMTNARLADDSVRYFLAKSKAIAERYKDERMLVVLGQIQAGYLLAKGRRQEALSMISRSLSESRDAEMTYLEINALSLYADYYEKNPDSVLFYYNSIYRLIQEKRYNFNTVPVLKVILAYTEKTGNKDKIIGIHRLMQTALAAENENLKKFTGDYIKYSAIQDDNRMLIVNNKNNRLKIWLLIAVCCVTILLVVFMYRLYKISRRLNKQVTEQNTQMQNALGALEQSHEDNTRMMKIVAHDLRNPIGGMMTVANLMLEEPGRSEDDRMLLELIRTSGQSSLELVSDLLQKDTKAEELKKEPVDLTQLLHYCVDLLQYKAEAKMQRIDLKAAPVTLSVDREKLWRVISNLVANAIKFSPSGATITVSLEKKLQQVIIAVEDYGIGIPMEMKDKIFDMFTEAKRAGTEGEQSFGLGLAISKQIVEAHGGRIWFNSRPGNGTTFFVQLPATPDTPVIRNINASRDRPETMPVS